MRQSFEEFLMNEFKKNYPDINDHWEHLNAWTYTLGVNLICQYAEEWSSQKPEAL